ncbi:MAG TPA: dihydrodipicolinate synthase family protein [Verrucomicrobiae bacterium]|nr:dihydrodipicolinate synthase family protein [Verrucomicrobiae bacterium]
MKSEVKVGAKYGGVVVPMVTPITADGKLDEPSVDRLVDSLLAGGVDGIFIMGTTGEGGSIPREYRLRLVKQTVKRVKGAARIFAGIGDSHPEEIAAGNDYLRAGADAVVSRPPVEIPIAGILPWYRTLLDGLNGPLVLYNMPMTTKVSIPLDVVEQLLGHPNFAGIKDSENNPARHEELLKRFSGRDNFSIFIGVGALMEKGLRLGADGIVPSVGNLIPSTCGKLCATARLGDWTEAETHFARMNAVAALYQKGRTLNESLSVLKAALHLCGFCAPHVFPPLKPVTEAQLQKLRLEMERLYLLNVK